MNKAILLTLLKIIQAPVVVLRNAFYHTYEALDSADDVVIAWRAKVDPPTGSIFASMPTGLLAEREPVDWKPEEDCFFTQKPLNDDGEPSIFPHVVPLSIAKVGLFGVKLEESTYLVVDALKWCNEQGLVYGRDFALCRNQSFDGSNWLIRTSVAFASDKGSSAMLCKLTFGGAA